MAKTRAFAVAKGVERKLLFRFLFLNSPFDPPESIFFPLPVTKSERSQLSKVNLGQTGKSI